MCAFDHLPRSEVEELIRQWIRSERDRAIVSRKWLEELIDKPDFNMNDYFEAIKLLAELEDI